MAPVDPALHSTDGLYYFPNNALEWKMLDEMHKGIDTYLGHKLSLGPAVQNVKKILEIGCGSGAWAIQAAQTYPEATVTAIDISPLPPRPLPSNMQFLQLNATGPLPFEPESFDIIHVRFVFVHLPNWKQVLVNVISLLKPRGWLWIEEADVRFYDDGPQALGPSLKAFNDKHLSHSRSRNVDALAASSLGSILKELESFSEVNDTGIKCPINGKDDGPGDGSMGRVLWTATRQGFANLEILEWYDNGINSELLEEMVREAEDPLRSIYLKLHMTWSQKK